MDSKNNNDKTLNIPTFDDSKSTSKESLEETKIITKNDPDTDNDGLDIIDFGNVYSEDSESKEDVFTRIKESLDEEAKRNIENRENPEETIVIPAIKEDGNEIPTAISAGDGDNGNDIPILPNLGNNNEDDNMPKKKNKLNRREKINAVLLTLVTLFFVGLLSFGTIWIIVSSQSEGLNTAALNNANSTKIYDQNNELIQDLGKMSSTAQENIDFNDMPESLVDAFVAVEDSRFFSHNGFDLPRFTKSFIKNVSTLSFSQGGSTLSMQLIKNSHLSPEKKIKRKIQEIDLAFELEREVTKQDIFSSYVNMINYGAGNSRGIESSSRYFFNKPAKELNLTESAILAGVINLPNEYSPIRNLEKSYERRDVAINLMKSHGYIEEKEAKLAKKIKIENLLAEDGIQVLDADRTPYLNYINVVIEEVKERTGEDAYKTGMEIYTNMDRVVQDRIEQIERGELFPYPDDLVQSAIAVVENDTGKLIAVGGGRDQAVALGYSRVTGMKNQPGSVTKPLLSYALAFEHLGWSTEHVVEDRPIRYAGTDHILKNFNGQYEGEVRLKDALARSLNTPAYATLEEVQGAIGDKAVVEYLNSIGFEVKPDEFNTQYSIGGSSFTINPKQLAGAQAVIMNQGKYTEPHTVNRVVINNQDELKDEFDYPTTQVLSPEAAYLTSVLEENNVSGGYWNYMGMLGGRGYPVYAKTGTTDYGSNGEQYGIPNGAAKEHWMMASSAKYTSAVWLGYDQPVAGKDTYFPTWKTEMNVTGKINAAILDVVHHKTGDPGRVPRPEGVTSMQHVLSVFPYAAPVDGMDPKYIVTGEIAKKYANLTNLSEVKLDIAPVSSFDVKVAAAGTNKKTITLKWSEYPEGGDIGSETYDISIPGAPATGKRLFHPSWIFGPIEYKASVRVDGKVVENINTADNNHSITLDINDDSTIRVCGYYGNKKQSGPEKCVEPANPKSEETIVVPNFNTLEEVNAFMQQHGLSDWTLVRTPAENAEQSEKIISVNANSKDIRNQSFTTSELKALKVEVNVYEKYIPQENKPEENNSEENKPETPTTP